MWYFSWLLGLGLALTFAVLNAMWYEMLESERRSQPPSPAVAAEAPSASHGAEPRL
jgi:cytochrome bd-I ubiquinol oxidase subunit X